MGVPSSPEPEAKKPRCGKTKITDVKKKQTDSISTNKIGSSDRLMVEVESAIKGATPVSCISHFIKKIIILAGAKSLLNQKFVPLYSKMR